MHVRTAPSHSCFVRVGFVRRSRLWSYAECRRKDGLDLTGQISKVHFLTLFLRAGLVGWPCLELLHSAGCGISGAVSLS